MPNSRIYLTMPAFAMKNPLLFFLTALKIRIISAQSSAVRECAGAHGVVITKRRSAPVTATVVKTSAGAAEHMRIARVVNLVSAIETLKKEGLWIAGADMAGNSMYEADMKGGFALVIGSEGSGLSKLVKEKCDFLVSVPIKGKIDSLNASVAAAIIMFEKNRQDSVN